jgi:hypothetical protein
MKPKIGYFKYSEAYSLTGEFSGFSQQSRDEKVKFLVAAIARHNPLAVVSAIPRDLHREVFAGPSARPNRRTQRLGGVSQT